MKNKVFVAVAVTTCFGVAVMAAATPGDSPLVSGSSPETSALDDPTIIAIFDAANTADMETGQLAVDRGHSKEVREFGAMLVRDHDVVRQMGRDLAAKLRVTPTPPTDDAAARAHIEAFARLRSLSGPAFDRALLEHEFAFHKAVIDAIQTTLLPAIKNDELRALVQNVAPAFEAHMLEARRLEQVLTGRPGN